MLVCPKCNTVYEEQVRFCSGDGMPLVPASVETFLASGQSIGGTFRVVARWRGDRLGEVYQVEELARPGNYCAIRLFRPGLLTTEIQAAIRQLITSVIGAQISPDLVTRYHELGFEDGRYALVSGYAPGRLLDEIVTQEAPLPPLSAVGILLRVAEILAEAHKSGWIHGNPTPENIVVSGDATSGGFVAKLLDFGLTRTIARFGSRVLCGSTGHLAVRNYETYLAPELLGPHPEAVDARADIYALGAMCYHLLSGHQPFSIDQVAVSGPVYITDDPRPLLTLRSELNIPQALEQLMLRSLSRDPELRPASMAEVLDVLNDLTVELSLTVSRVLPVNPNATGGLVETETNGFSVPPAATFSLPGGTRIVGGTAGGMAAKAAAQTADTLKELEPPPTPSVPLPQPPVPQLRVASPSVEVKAVPVRPVSARPSTPRPSAARGRWVGLAAAVVLALALAVGAVMVYVKRTPPVGSVIVVTAPEGATVFLDGKAYDPTPTTLQNVTAGTHMVKVTKDGFTVLEKEIVVEPGQPVEVTLSLKPLKPELPPVTGTPAERIAEFLRLANEAFTRGDFVEPENDNVLYFAEAVLAIQPGNDDAQRLRAQVREALAKQAQVALGRSDLATAQNSFTFLAQKFPEDPRGPDGLRKVTVLIEAQRGQMSVLLQKATDALDAGRLVEPPMTSAYFYAAQVLAIDRRNTQATMIRTRIKSALQQQAEAAFQAKDYAAARTQYQKLIRSFPEDRRLAVRLREIDATIKTRTAEDAQAATPDPRRLRESGLQKMRSGDYAGAVSDLESAVTGGVADVDVYYALGYAHLKRGETANARKYFTLAVQANPAHGPSLGQLGMLAEQARDLDKAVTYYERAVRAGGGGDFSAATLQQRLESIRGQLERAREPAPFSTQVTREGGFFDSGDSGTLSVGVSGLSYVPRNGKDGFSVSLDNVSELRGEGDKLIVRAAGKKYTFRCSSGTKFLETYTACRNFKKNQ